MRTAQIEPVSNMVKDYRGLLAKLDKGPVYLAARSRPAAVLVAPAMWDDLLDQLETLQDIVDVLEAKLEFIQSREPQEEFDPDEFPALADVQAAPLSSRQAAVAPIAPVQ